ncbi:Sec-independent protein translocase subunit TatA [Corynebacterium terpenotabidum]|uniref:Sec-independent protein translocase protein TatA n=1 Tax=Corynebacterium terpenotabidum Y-11 TaxID=1200352 RepID=S4XJJ5_9CORY|nr:Sec-independent protein translocase subunit TatA [Corynebacterium terpenotabidum]AGP30748.1 Sec-independent protein translocase protein [Corynebacterium terpenotabidum Y-11]
MGNLGTTEILLILLVIVLLFGAAKLPKMARSLGQSMRIFKSEMKEMKNDDKPAVEAPAAPSAEAEAARRIADPTTTVTEPTTTVTDAADTRPQES